LADERRRKREELLRATEKQLARLARPRIGNGGRCSGKKEIGLAVGKVQDGKPRPTTTRESLADRA
jgi:hypothetical protein